MILWAHGLHGDFITGKHPVVSKSTGSSLYMLPQYTVALRVSIDYSKVAYLKWSKSLLQPALRLTHKETQIATATYVGMVVE